MSSEIDLSGEHDPEERMQMHERVARPDTENERDEEYSGSETTEDFDVQEALEQL